MIPFLVGFGTGIVLMLIACLMVVLSTRVQYATRREQLLKDRARRAHITQIYSR